MALPALVAAAMLAMLVFLFLRTHSGDYKAGAEALGELRAMQDVDARWSSEARLVAAGNGDAPSADYAGMLERSLRALERAPGGIAVADRAVLRSGVAEKASLFTALRDAHRRRLTDPPVAEAEAAALQRFEYHTLGSRLALAQRSLAQHLEQSLDETDRWRVYLAFYAAALLVGVGYLAARVGQAQAALRAANENLERRVVERTHELQSALQRLRESEAQLVQTEKMSSLGQLVAGVAHEINTPLAYVKNSVASVSDRLVDLEQAIAQSEQLLALLQSASPDGNALQACFASLGERLARLARDQVLHDLETLTRDGLHGIEQISDLVTNLRNFSRLDRSRVASYNVNESVRGTLLIARPLLRNVDVEKRLGEVPSITCSPSQVNQVLLNLVTNAAQAIERPDGRIVVTTRREGTAAVAIEVSDNGRGIAPEVLPRIFDPFFTTKDVGKGTGLGLSIAYKIVSAHGGRIDVRTQPGDGTTFTVTLPMEPPAEAVAATVVHGNEEVPA
jgi:two-component system NtrC family sensor kinase